MKLFNKEKKNFSLLTSQPSFSHGFTLIELLIVITILGILAAGVLVAIDPGEKIKQTNDTKVQIDVSAIGRAAEAYAIQQGGSYPASASELATYGELRKLPNPPSSAYGTSYTYTALPANCTTAAKDCTSITVTSPLLSKKYSAAAANTPFWKYESTTGTSCAVADPTYSCSAPLPTPTPISANTPTSTITPTPTWRRVFATSTRYNGNLLAAGRAINSSVATGLEGGDTICNSRATAASLGGTWKAWLSTSSVNAKDRIPDKEYRLVNNTTVVANSKADLLDNSLDNAINKDESNAAITSGFDVWTETKSDGSYRIGTSCASWTDDASYSGLRAARGFTESTGGGWTISSDGSCSTTNRLYCFEQ